MKVLVVAPQPFFSPRGTPFSVYYRTLVTSELGHQVDVLTYGQGVDVEIPNVRLVRIPAFKLFGKVKTGPSVFKLFLDAFMLAWTVGLMLRNRYDVVHAHEEAVFWCRWLKPVFRNRLIYDMHSSLPQQLKNFDFTRLRLVHQLFEGLENSALRASDAVITICPALHDHAKTITGKHDKLLLIENSIFDPIQLAPGQNSTEVHGGSETSAEAVAADAWLRRRQTNGTIAYAGTLEAYQGIDKLLEAFAVTLRDVPEASLLIIGGLPRQVEHYRRRTEQLGTKDHVYFTGQLPQTDAQRLVAGAAACVSPRFSGTNTPLKIYHLMASGVPLVATRIDSHTQVLTDEIATLTDADIQGLGAGMTQVLKAPEAARDKASKAQDVYRDRYSRDVYVGKMQTLFDLVS
ncbi:glycosyltransferase family 4 protein [Methylonatrum kenyense]|uniref:glycosyltransferase family 4 protein n=1 Tax=Methylonatrum kenyense TaxID=455253 RepID=UPI0020BDFC16|nr:glycosyltransferase family 4 protein [Methylonatrum kenyense]MCK8516809.1 glycosyltransferase family 4 protein [Methylonatrum kenyense]